MLRSLSSSLRRMTPLVLAGLMGLAGNLVADEVGLVNGFVATLIVITSWVAFDPRVNPPPTSAYESADLGMSREEILAIQQRYLRRGQIWLGVPTLVAALLGGWENAALYSFIAFASAILLGIGAVRALYEYTKRRVARRVAS